MANTKVETTIQKGFDTVKNTTEKINKNAINFADSLVDETLATGKEWQNVMAKVMKTGTTLFGKQQDFVLDTLEAVKAQYFTGTKRFGKLFSFNISDNKIEKGVTKTTKVVKKKTAVTTKPKAVTQKNNLKVIEGVGPKLESILNEAGITTFKKLSTMKAEAVKEILLAAGSRYKMHNPSTWAAQAKLADAGKMVELKALQAELKNGKTVK